MTGTEAARKRPSRFALMAAAALASLLITVLALEGALRVYSALFFPKMMVLDDSLGWRHARNASKIFPNELGEGIRVVQNALGHRGRLHDTQRGAGTLRVLVLGDSFTEGAQVSEGELFNALLEAADPRLQVINSGVAGWGTVQEYLYLAAEGSQLDPDLVVLMFFENDLSDNLLAYSPGMGPRPHAVLAGGKLTIVEKPDTSEYQRFTLPAPFRSLLNEHSYIYSFLNSRVYQRMRADSLLQMQRADLKRLSSEMMYTAFYQVLDRLRGLLAARKIPLLVVLIPSREEVAAGKAEPLEAISEHCRASSIQCISLLERLNQETAAGAKPYFAKDMHWTRDGHRIAADEILKHLRSIRDLQSGAPGTVPSQGR